MSLLSSIKTKLSTAKLDFSKSVGLPFLSTKLQDKPAAETEAGFALLSLYQSYWSDIHRASEANASRAQEVDAVIADIAAKLNQQVTNVNQFLTEMSKFAEIQSEIDTAKERIASLGTSCSELEDELVALEDVCNEMQQNNNKFEHEYQLRKYRERKHLELEQVKANMAKQHASRMHQFEQRTRKQLKERQKVFEAAFVEQMANYRALGRVQDDTVAAATPAISKDLSDVTIDDDYSLLDEFLSSSAQQPDPATGQESSPTESTTVTEAVEDSRQPGSLQTVTDNVTVNRTEWN